MVGKMDAVGFIIKSMVERDPSKRRVKPSLQALEDFDGIELEESSDDSDFTVGDKDDEDADSNLSDEDGKDDDSNDEDDEDEEKSSDDAAPIVAEPKSKLTVKDLIQRVDGAMSKCNSHTVKPLKVCCVCLSDTNQEHNEIIECDKCHISAHEECYGVSESASVSSCEESPCNTIEPWFCEACRSGIASLRCDLCPVVGGLLKRTDTGRWVHLICALYIPGVAFVDLDRLTSITLFEVSYTRWGSKTCTLCENPLFARTGITIQCDAGMCKATFHVTCAQRHGLLEEVRHEELGADPYFAHCRVHSDKTALRKRKNNFAAMEQYRRGPHALKMDAGRLESRLARARSSQRAEFWEQPATWTPTMKLLRPVASSAYLCRMLVRRAELLGAEALSVAVTSHAQVSTAEDVAKKWHVPPAFSAEFVSYFLERDNRLNSLKQHLAQLLAEQQLLEDRDKHLTAERWQIDERLSAARQMGALLRSEVNGIYDSLCRLVDQPIKRPKVLLQPSPKRQRRSSEVSACSPQRQCVQCGGGGDCHSMVVCETCDRAYHRHCLQTPLSRITRSSRLDSWRCWRCVDAEVAHSSSGQASVRSKRVRQPTTHFQNVGPVRRRSRRSMIGFRRRNRRRRTVKPRADEETDCVLNGHRSDSEVTPSPEKKTNRTVSPNFIGFPPPTVVLHRSPDTSDRTSVLGVAMSKSPTSDAVQSVKTDPSPAEVLTFCAEKSIVSAVDASSSELSQVDSKDLLMSECTSVGLIGNNALNNGALVADGSIRQDNETADPSTAITDDNTNSSDCRPESTRQVETTAADAGCENATIDKTIAVCVDKCQQENTGHQHRAEPVESVDVGSAHQLTHCDTHIVLHSVVADDDRGLAASPVADSFAPRRRRGRPPLKYIGDSDRCWSLQYRPAQRRPRSRPPPSGRRPGRPRGSRNKYPRGTRGFPSHRRRRGVGGRSVRFAGSRDQWASLVSPAVSSSELPASSTEQRSVAR